LVRLQHHEADHDVVAPAMIRPSTSVEWASPWLFQGTDRVIGRISAKKKAATSSVAASCALGAV
jgi:hypothetical protein